MGILEGVSPAGSRGATPSALAPAPPGPRRPAEVPTLEAELHALAGPVLVLSTRVGRGMFSLGEAVVERLAPRRDVLHRGVEEFLPGAALAEDVRRYRMLSSRFPVLLNLPYRFPPIYARKLLRERWLARTDLGALARFLRAEGVRSVVAVSHRPAFWTGCLLERGGADVTLVGLLGEYGSSLGWRYVPWPRIATYLSPVPRAALRFELPARTRFVEVELPARAEYEALRDVPGRRDAVLVVCGAWGQGRIDRVVRELLSCRGDLTVHAVCGDNEGLRRRVERAFRDRPGVHVHGTVGSLAPLLAECASLVTKPGIATLVEAHAARRKLFLVRGMPVAEDSNLRHALAHFGAERFDAGAFRRWLEAGR